MRVGYQWDQTSFWGMVQVLRHCCSSTLLQRSKLFGFCGHFHEFLTETETETETSSTGVTRAREIISDATRY